jgi:hypothetical protein
MKAYGSGCIDPLFLTSALVGGEWSTSRAGRFTPGTHWIGSWVDLRVGLDDLETRKFWTLPGLELRPLGRPASRYTDYASLSNTRTHSLMEVRSC